MAQLLLFEESHEEKLERKMRHLEEKIENMRKGQFGKIGALQSQVKTLIEQMEFLQSNIAKKGYYL
jgi:polyhydroxyalkanoate synthesis regulator phasin